MRYFQGHYTHLNDSKVHTVSNSLICSFMIIRVSVVQNVLSLTVTDLSKSCVVVIVTVKESYLLLVGVIKLWLLT